MIILLKDIKNFPPEKAVEAYKDCNALYTIWGRIMHYSTNIERILREHLTLENKGKELGKIIELFKQDSEAINFPNLLQDLEELNKKCRILWAHGALVYSFEDGKMIKCLIYDENQGNGSFIEKEIIIDNDYFDNIANILFPKVFNGLFEMFDKRKLKNKTGFMMIRF